MENRLTTSLNEYQDARRNAFVTAIMMKQNGACFAGVFGRNIPREILWTAGIVPVDLFSIDDSNIVAAEKVLPKSFCDLLKASYGYAITDKCPFIHSADIVIGSSFCADKLLILDRLGKFKEVYIVPEIADTVSLTVAYREFAAFLERYFDIRITDEKLFDTIGKINTYMKRINQLTDLFLSGADGIGNDDYHSIVYSSRFIFDLEERLARLTEVTDILHTRNLKADALGGKEPIRLLICGSPLTGIREKVLQALDRLEQNIRAVVYSPCEGQNNRLTSLTGDPYAALAEKYLLPEPGFEAYLAEKYRVSGMINVVFDRCRTLPINDNLGNMPQLSFYTGYGNEDGDRISEQLKGFIKML